MHHHELEAYREVQARLEHIDQTLHLLIREFRTMSASFKDQLDRQTAALTNLKTAVEKEMQQLRDAIANSSGITPEEAAQMETNIANTEAAVAALASDDPAPTS